MSVKIVTAVTDMKQLKTKKYIFIPHAVIEIINIS